MNTINLWRELKTSIRVAVVLLLITCGAYPLAVWGIAQIVFPGAARGSMLRNEQGTVIGSALIGQMFTAAKYFHGRPSLAGNGYDAASSGGSNLGETSKALMDTIQARANRYRRENGLGANAEIPADAVTASASGLDPDITLENAWLQAGRVAKARDMDTEAVRQAVRAQLQGRDLGILGEPRVNVLKLNLALDELK